MTPDCCPLCRAQSSMIEHLKANVYFCNSCGQAFMLDDTGKLIGRQATNHAPKRKTDINNVVMDDGD